MNRKEFMFSRKCFDLLALCPDLLTENEVEYYLGIFSDAINFKHHHLETLRCCSLSPVCDGDIVSKQTVSDLLDGGYVSKVYYKNSEGYTATTYKGGALLRILIGFQMSHNVSLDGVKNG